MLVGIFWVILCQVTWIWHGSVASLSQRGHCIPFLGEDIKIQFAPANTRQAKREWWGQWRSGRGCGDIYSSKWVLLMINKVPIAPMIVTWMLYCFLPSSAFRPRTWKFRLIYLRVPHSAFCEYVILSRLDDYFLPRIGEKWGSMMIYMNVIMFVCCLFPPGNDLLAKRGLYFCSLL